MESFNGLENFPLYLYFETEYEFARTYFLEFRGIASVVIYMF